MARVMATTINTFNASLIACSPLGDGDRLRRAGAATMARLCGGREAQPSGRQRQFDAGDGAAAIAVAQARAAAVEYRDLGHERQPQPAAAAATVGARQRIEAFEDAAERV